MIRGRAYHPESQGSIERANRTFKTRLRAIQAQKGVSNWVVLLPELALVINTSTSRALPPKMTPFQAWFGRKPRWNLENHQIDQESGQENDQESIESGENTDIETDDDDLVLTEIETRVATNNVRLQAQMIKANNGKFITFKAGAVATLRIPPKIRRNIESSRLPVRVLKAHKTGQYTLQCQYGKLKGQFTGGELNSVYSNNLGTDISVEPLRNSVTLAKAVAQANNRGSINAGQKAGRKRKAVDVPATLVPSDRSSKRIRKRTTKYGE